MLRHFSTNRLSFEDLNDTTEDFLHERIARRPCVLGPGTEFFLDGKPIEPMLSSATITKAFSGSHLDLSAFSPDLTDDTLGTPATPPLGSPPSLTPLRQNDPFRYPHPPDPPSRTPEKPHTTAVLGAQNYLAGYTIHALLERGHEVRVIVPDPPTLRRLRPLQQRARDAHRLSLHLLPAPGPDASYDEILYGVDTVFVVQHAGAAHLPSPGALEAFTRVVGSLRRCREPSQRDPRRVVLTGPSVSAAGGRPGTGEGGEGQTVWEPFEEVAAEARVEWVRLQPGLVIGPVGWGDVADATRVVEDLVMGSGGFPFAPRTVWNFVDVRDLAAANVAAMESARVVPYASVVGATLTLPQIGRFLIQLYPSLRPPTRDAPHWLTIVLTLWRHPRTNLRRLWHSLDNHPSGLEESEQKDLCVRYTPWQRTVEDIVDQLVAEELLVVSPESTSSWSFASYGAGIAAILGVLCGGWKFLNWRRKYVKSD